MESTFVSGPVGRRQCSQGARQGCVSRAAVRGRAASFRGPREHGQDPDRTDEILALQMVGRFDIADRLLGNPAGNVAAESMAYAQLLQDLHLGRHSKVRADAKALLAHNDEREPRRGPWRSGPS